MGTRRFTSIAIRGALVLALAFVLAESGVRFLLFADAADGSEIARGLRSPGRMGYTTVDDDYWLLRGRFEPAAARKPPPGFDPVLGWTGHRELRSGAYARAQRELLAGRRPVLLYGDSFAQGRAGRRGGFRGALESTELGADLLLVNYGVGGYGLDQIHLMLTGTVDEWADLSPVVMVGLLVDDDLDRCLLSFRQWPKPRLQLRDGELVPERDALPTLAEALEQVPRSTTSYALRLLLHRAPPAGERDAKLRAERELCERLLVETVEFLRARELEHFFVLFHGTRSIESTTGDWRESLVTDTLRALDAPWVSTRSAIGQHVERTGRPLEELFDETGHLSPVGNRVAFRAMADGLAGRYAPEPTRGLPSVALIADTVLRGEAAVARFEYGPREPFTDPADLVRLCMRVGREGPTELSYRLDGRARAFRARLSLIPKPRSSHGSVGVTILADGEPLLRTTLRRGEAAQTVEVDLRGRQRMTVRVDDAGDGVRGDSLVFAAPVFESAL